MDRLPGRITLVTGTTAGLGAASARRPTAEGASAAPPDVRAATGHGGGIRPAGMRSPSVIGDLSDGTGGTGKTGGTDRTGGGAAVATAASLSLQDTPQDTAQDAPQNAAQDAAHPARAAHVTATGLAVDGGRTAMKASA